jgi:hypothetical protein
VRRSLRISILDARIVSDIVIDLACFEIFSLYVGRGFITGIEVAAIVSRYLSGQAKDVPRVHCVSTFKDLPTQTRKEVEAGV